MTEQNLFELGFKKEVDYDNGDTFIDYKLSNVDADVEDLIVFQDKDTNNGNWTLCISSGYFREVDIETLKWLINTYKEIEERLPIIKEQRQ